MPINLITASVTVLGAATAANANTLTIIAAGAVRVSTASNALVNGFASDNCDVRVDGTLIGEFSAVFLTTNGVTDSHSLTVGATGLLLANTGFGAYVQGANASVLNYGQIGSVSNYGVLMNGASARLENFGAIYSIAGTGVSLGGVIAVLRNFGSITADNAGATAINLSNSLGNLVENYGTVSGGSASIFGSANADTIFNYGTLSGFVVLNGGFDLFNGAGGRAVTVSGGTGDDTIRGSFFDDTLGGDADNDRIIGRTGDDRLFGGTGADRLLGGGDDDLLNGGANNDLLSGGTGADQFQFSSAADIGTGALSDRITDFKSGEDKIDLSIIGVLIGLNFIAAAAFSNVAGQLRYDVASRQLQGDTNGDSLADFVLVLDGVASLTAGDLIL